MVTMTKANVPTLQLLRSMRALTLETPITSQTRSFTGTSFQSEQAQTQVPSESFYKNPDPETVFVPRLERKLTRAGVPLIGSRRRRMAIATSQGIPFDQLPYQCFQEARKVLIDDRAEKIKKIELERARIARLEQVDATTIAGGESQKQRRLQSMQRELEHLKILADMNDPNVKRRFEDGKGDMNKPIYRYLAERKWRTYRQKVQVQRLMQMKVAPDVVPHLDHSLDTAIAFGTYRPSPGDFVPSHISENPCTLNIQSFDRGTKLVTVAVIDPDVPNLASNAFDSRCHFLASNVPITPTTPQVDLAGLSGQSQVLLPWLAPTAHKGSPYHRLAVVVFQQKDNIPIDMAVASKKVARKDFSARAFMTRHMLHPIGGALFRTKWDESMPEVMSRVGNDDVSMELKRTKVEPLPYKRRNPSTFR